jgi:hypothetical protein
MTHPDAVALARLVHLQVQPNCAPVPYCSMYCQLCRLLDRLEGLRTLAANIAIGAGLCQAFHQGVDWSCECTTWLPGCGRPLWTPQPGARRGE